MKIKNIFILLTVLSVALILLCGCHSEDKNIQEQNKVSVISSLNTGEIKQSGNVKKYKYMKGIASFARTYKDGYVFFTDTDYRDGETYTGKVRWCDEIADGTIVSASQVIEVSGKELYNQPLEIVSLEDDTWDHMASYCACVKARCAEDETADCYIKLSDSNNVEYRVMLTPQESLNYDGYFGSAVYIIDQDNNCEFWYDDLIENT